MLRRKTFLWSSPFFKEKCRGPRSYNHEKGRETKMKTDTTNKEEEKPQNLFVVVPVLSWLALCALPLLITASLLMVTGLLEVEDSSCKKK